MKNKNSSKDLQYNYFKTQTQEVKVLAAQPEDLRLIPETKGGEGGGVTSVLTYTQRINILK
jgi:hypothetical protein